MIVIKKYDKLNLTAIQISSKVPLGLSKDELIRVLGQPHSSKMLQNHKLMFFYFNSDRRSDGNHIYPLSIQVYLKNDEVTNMLFNVK